MFESNLGFDWGWTGENVGRRPGGRLDGGAGAVR